MILAGVADEASQSDVKKDAAENKENSTTDKPAAEAGKISPSKQMETEEEKEKVVEEAEKAAVSMDAAPLD